MHFCSKKEEIFGSAPNFLRGRKSIRFFLPGAKPIVPSVKMLIFIFFSVLTQNLLYSSRSVLYQLGSSFSSQKAENLARRFVLQPMAFPFKTIVTWNALLISMKMLRYSWCVVIRFSRCWRSFEAERYADANSTANRFIVEVFFHVHNLSIHPYLTLLSKYRDSQELISSFMNSVCWFVVDNKKISFRKNLA